MRHSTVSKGEPRRLRDHFVRGASRKAGLEAGRGRRGERRAGVENSAVELEPDQCPPKATFHNKTFVARCIFGYSGAITYERSQHRMVDQLREVQV